MLKIITNNFWIKVVCVLIATSVWVYVANSESKVDDFPGSIPIEIRNKPQDLVVIKDIEFIQIKIIAERGVWKNISADTFSAYIDLSGLEEGVHELPINVDINIEGIQIVEVNPSKALVRLEPETTKNVPISVKTEGEAAEGYVPGESIIDEKEALIIGAESVIDKINQVYAVVRLNGESEDIENKVVSLVAYNEKNEEIKNIQIEPDNILVNLSVIRASQTKTVGIKVNTIGSPKQGYWVNNITTEPATVVITGPSSLLAQTEFIQTKNVNIDDYNSNKVTVIELNLPNSLILVGGQPNKVTAKINISESTTQKEVYAKINYENIPSDLKISNVNPDNVKVVVSGSEEVLSKINSEDIKINLNLSGLSEGKNDLTISADIISVPDDVSVTNYIPNLVSITLQKK